VLYEFIETNVTGEQIIVMVFSIGLIALLILATGHIKPPTKCLKM